MTPLEDLERESRLRHIAEAAMRLLEITAGRTVVDYRADISLRWAVERGLLIIGEAAVRLRRADPQIASCITNFAGISGFRNRIVHDYPNTDVDVVWHIITDDLPLLLAEVRALLPPE